ncbi:hypothetical protein BJX65DRAFT_314733 [Aspergillus insuetus]
MASSYFILLLGSLAPISTAFATTSSPQHEACYTTLINCKITSTVTEPVVPPVTTTLTTTIIPTECPPCPPLASNETGTGGTPPPVCSAPVQSWAPLRLDWTDDFPKPGDPEPFSFTTSFDYPTILTVTGDRTLFEQFTIYLGLEVLGKTLDISSSPNWGQVDCGTDANECQKKGFSQGSFNIPPGEQTITITWENVNARPDTLQECGFGSGQYRFDRVVQCTEEEKEQENQKKIQAMGKCVQGYPWKRIPGGYVCEGGTHHITDEELANYQV